VAGLEEEEAAIWVFIRVTAKAWLREPIKEASSEASKIVAEVSELRDESFTFTCTRRERLLAESEGPTS
jgi:hypothetical protein